MKRLAFALLALTACGSTQVDRSTVTEVPAPPTTQAEWEPCMREVIYNDPVWRDGEVDHNQTFIWMHKRCPEITEKYFSDFSYLWD